MAFLGYPQPGRGWAGWVKVLPHDTYLSLKGKELTNYKRK